MSQESDVIRFYFLDLWRLQSKAAAAAAVAATTSSSASELSPDDSEFEKESTELDMVSSSGGFSLIGVDKLPIQYLSVNLHSYDVGIVEANKTAPSKSRFLVKLWNRCLQIGLISLDRII